MPLSSDAGGATVREPSQEATGSSTAVLEQSDRAEFATDRAADPELPEERQGASPALPAALLRHAVHRCGGGVVGQGGPGARAFEWTRNAAHSRAGIPRVQKEGIPAAGWISVSHLYNLRRSCATAGKQRCSSRHGRRRCRSPSGASPNRKTGPAFCGWTPCIRATGRAPRASTTSMRWTR
jgi:hypothetical protein